MAVVCVINIDGSSIRLKPNEVYRIGRKSGLEISIANESMELAHATISLLRCGVVRLAAVEGKIFAQGLEKVLVDVSPEDAIGGHVQLRFGTVEATLEFDKAQESTGFGECLDDILCTPGTQSPSGNISSNSSSISETEEILFERATESDPHQESSDESISMGTHLGVFTPDFSEFDADDLDISDSPPQEEVDKKPDILLDTTDLEKSSFNWSGSASTSTAFNVSKSDEVAAHRAPLVEAKINSPDLNLMVVKQEQAAGGIKQLHVATIEKVQTEELPGGSNSGARQDVNAIQTAENKENIPQGTSSSGSWITEFEEVIDLNEDEVEDFKPSTSRARHYKLPLFKNVFQKDNNPLRLRNEQAQSSKEVAAPNVDIKSRSPTPTPTVEFRVRRSTRSTRRPTKYSDPEVNRGAKKSIETGKRNSEEDPEQSANKRGRKNLNDTDEKDSEAEAATKKDLTAVKKEDVSKNKPDDPIPSDQDDALKDINKYVTNAQSKGKLKITFTRCNHKALEPVLKALEDLIEITDNPQVCDLLIMEKGERTYKFLVAIAANKPVLGTNWLESVRATKSVTIEEDHLFKDAGFEMLYSYKSTSALKHPRFFDGLNFMVSTGIQPNSRAMKAIIKSAGGKVHHEPPPLANSLDLYVVSNGREEDFKKLRHYENTHFINTTQVMDSLVQKNLQLLDVTTDNI